MWITIVIMLEEKWNVLKGTVFKDTQYSHKEKSASSHCIKFEPGAQEQCFPLWISKPQ